MPEERDSNAIRAACTRFVVGHYPQSPRDMLATLADFTPADTMPDAYGGGMLADFEAQIAALLGKPAAVFMVSGTMAQQIALRIWAERTGIHTFACHPTCHLEVHEDWAYRTLHGLHAELVGDRYSLMTLEALQSVNIPLGALLLELPQRPIGGILPAWDDLVAMTSWAREQRIPLHLDGARLWECKPFYGREYAEIAGLFDTVYVSFYKILDGFAGAVLAGPEDVIAEARVWNHRHGGRLVRLYPYALSAQKGLADHLDKMTAYHDKAIEIAEALQAIEGIVIKPNPPHTNMMHLFIRGDLDKLRDAALDIAEETKVWLWRGISPSQVPGYVASELTVGDATLDMDTEEIAWLYADVVRRGS